MLPLTQCLPLCNNNTATQSAGLNTKGYK